MHPIHHILYYTILFGLIGAGINACVNMKKYRVGFYSLNGKVYYGPWHYCEDLIKAWAEHGNKKYPEINHFVDTN